MELIDDCVISVSRLIDVPVKGNSMVVMTFLKKKISEAIGHNSELKY